MTKNAPYWAEIWDKQSWEMFEPRALHSRKYYKIRSLFRMALWLPIGVATAYAIVALAAVFQ